MVTITQSKQTIETTYSHEKWELKRRFLRLLLKTIGIPWLIKIDSVKGIENIPQTGPAILLINHIAFVDPIVVLHVTPRNIVPMAKVEVYEYPIIGILPKIWGVIPVRRNEVDRRAIKQALAVLSAGEIILVAPEGTRNEALQEGKEGIAYLASKTMSPIVPVAIEGTPGFPTYPFSKRWRGEGAKIQFGKPFCYKASYRNAKAKQLRKMTDEAMFVLAAMLPENRRGHYANLENATMDTIMWCT